MYFLTIPLVDRKGKPQGRVSRWVDGGKTFVIPRIGEYIWIAPETKVEIVSVSYDGPALQMAHVKSEPLSDEFKESLLRTTFGKKKTVWAWSES